MSRKEEIIGDASLYSAMSVLTQIITLAAGILTRRFLGPVQMGIWSLLQIVLIYSSYSALGVTEAISREIPYYRGRGEYEKAEEMKDIIYSFSTFTSGLIAAGCVIYALVMNHRLRPEMFWGLLVMPLMILLQRTNNLYIAFLRGYKLFTIAAKQMIYSAIVNAFLVSVLSLKFQVYGFMLAMCLSFLFNIGYIRRHHRFSFKWRFELKKIWGLIQYGFPLIVVSMLSTVFLTIDKMMIAGIVGVRELGLYSVALMAYSYLHNLPNSIGIVLIPNFHQKFGETDKAEGLRDYLAKSSQVFETVMPLLIATGWFLIPYFARLVLPDFEGSIPPMKYLITSVFFVALIHPYSYFLVVIRKQVLLLPIIGSACVLAFLFNLYALKHGFGIIGVGIVTTIVFFVNFSTTYLIACKYIYSRRETAVHYGVIVLKFWFMIAVLTALSSVIRNADRSLILSCLQLCAFICIYAPFMYKLNKDLEILKTLKNKFLRRIAPEDEPVDA